MKNLLTVLFVFGAVWLGAQTYSIKGIITDQENTPLSAALVELQQPWGDLVKSTVADLDGKFELKEVGRGGYVIKISYLGYEDFKKEVTVSNQNILLEPLKMESSALALSEVEVTTKAPIGTQKGDTSEFNATAFKVMKDAAAGDLIEKMPSVTVEGGQIKAQGENVSQVLVDGKPFFGNDPTAALRNLPAEVVDKIQIFDQQSEQSQFTGFNDGNTVKTINIVTKSNMRAGQFGKIYGGYGYEDKYQVGGNVNFFNGTRRVSILGMSNNINVQNFAAEDILGAMGGGGRGGFRGGGGGGFGGGGGRGGGGFGDFLVQPNGGITTTHAIGINYSDQWGKKIEVSGSYFFNKGIANSEELLNRQFYDEEGISEIYDESTFSESDNINHRFNLRFEYQIDSSNSLLFRPRLTLQQNTGSSLTSGQTMLVSSLLNESDYNYFSNYDGLNYSGSLLWRHKFGKQGRTFSVDVSSGYAPKKGDNQLLSTSSFYQPTTVSDTLDQQSILDANSWNVAANIEYTEPLTKNSQLSLSYRISYQQEESDKSAYDFEEATGRYSLLNEQLSNVFSNDYVTHRGGLGYNFNKGRDMNLVLRANAQWSDLVNDQVFPNTQQFSQTFFNVVPFAMLRYNFDRQRNIRVFYRTSTDLPSIDQLQNVVDNSNPLQLSVGNPDLKQSFAQNLFIRYQAANPAKSTVFFAMIGGGLTSDYIAKNTFFAGSDDPIFDEYDVQPGAQITRPTNLNGYRNFRTFASYGIPFGLIKSNLNFDVAYNYSRTPGMLNDAVNYANNNTLSVGLTLSSNISDKVDFNISTRPAWSKVNNSLQTKANNEFLNQNTRLRFNWIIAEGFVFRTDVAHQYYAGLSDAFDQNYILWNMGIGKKVFKNQRGEITLSVNDLLKQNRNISRNVTEIYIEDVRTNALQQFFMLSFTYNLRNFNGNQQQQSDMPRPPFGGGWDPNRRGGF